MGVFSEILAYAYANTFEAIGAASGLLCVWLLIRQNIWNFPLGALYAIVSVWIFLEDRLYGQVLLHIYFVAMNLYGLYHWIYGRPADATALPVRRATRTEWLVVGLLALFAVGVLATVFNTFTDADYAYADFALTAGSVAAMGLTARKCLENWILWLLVDIGYAVLFWITDNYFYLFLYLVYIPMAFAGYRQWRQSMTAHAGGVSAVDVPA